VSALAGVISEIPAAALHDVTRITDVAVSPDGSRVALLTRSPSIAEFRVRGYL